MTTITISNTSSRFLFAIKRNALPLGLLVFLTIAIGVPMVVMILFTFGAPDSIGVGEALASFTFDNYEKVFGDPSTYRLLLNTIGYAAGSITFGLSIALVLAWLVERTDMPGRTLLYSLMFIPMAIPPFATATGWLLLLGPNAGAINVWTRDLFELSTMRGPFSIYSIWGMIFVTGLAVAPTMWLLLLANFRNMDPALEEAGSTVGFNRFNVLRRITVPLMRPGTMGVIAYYGVVALAIFEIPLAIGTRAGIPVLSTQLFLLTRSGALEGEPNYGIAATFGLISMIAAGFFMYLYLRVLRDNARFSVVTGKGFRPRRIGLKKFKWLALGLVLLYFLAQVIAPFLMLLWSSFLPYYRTPSFEALSYFSFINYQDLFENPRFNSAVINTIIVVLVSSTLVVGLASVISWFVVRRPSLITRLINIVAFSPLALPATVVSLALLVLFIPTPLYGSIILLIIGYTIGLLAFTTRLTNAAQIQLDKSLEEAAMTSGLSPVSTFFRITIVLMLPALLNGWMWAAVHIVRNFTLPLFLAGFSSPMMANIIFQRFENGGPEAGAAPIVLLVLAVMIMAFASRRLFQGDNAGAN